MSDTAETPARRPAKRQKVPAFARYKGTSAWQKHRNKRRSYARFRAEQPAATQA